MDLMMIINKLKTITMTNEYEMQNFWKQNKKAEEKEEKYCYYSDLPSPLAYIDLEKDLEVNKLQQKNI
jgi:hypothetical protein